MANESTLPPRYQIRKLTSADLDWARAIIVHSNLFNSPVWSVIYPESKGNAAQQAYNMFKALDYHHLHAIGSGHSYGVFDTEYVFKRPESAATGGKLYWDFEDLSATGADLLKRMDYPLVHVALGYDAFDPMDHSKLEEFISYIPELGILFKTIEEEDPRDPEGRKPKALGQAIIRAGTCTRGDYEGKGLTKRVAHWYMREKAKAGFKSIQIDSAAKAVDTVWGNPPPPFKAEVTSSFETKDLEVEENGVKKKPFVPADVWCARTVVTLRSD